MFKLGYPEVVHLMYFHSKYSKLRMRLLEFKYTANEEMSVHICVNRKATCMCVGACMCTDAPVCMCICVWVAANFTNSRSSSVGDKHVTQ